MAMATLAESFLADLDDLSDVSDQEEGAGQDNGEDEEVSLYAAGCISRSLARPLLTSMCWPFLSSR